LQNAIKAHSPALHARRRNEPVAMDTICGPVGHPGSIHAQFFIGPKFNYQSMHPCGKSNNEVHRCILDKIRKLKAMDILISD
jgi:hypothetical protein